MIKLNFFFTLLIIVTLHLQQCALMSNNHKYQVHKLCQLYMAQT